MLAQGVIVAARKERRTYYSFVEEVGSPVQTAPSKTSL